MSQTNKDFIIQDYLDMLKKYKLWIAASVIAMAVIFGGLKYVTYHPTFTAQTSLLVTSNAEGEEGSKTSSDYNVSSNVLMTFSEVLNSQTLKAKVKEELESDNLGYISVSNNAGSVIRINVTHSDPTIAAITANATAKVFTDMVQNMMSDISLQVLDPAAIPQYTEDMGLSKVVIVGALVGFVLVVGIILVREMLDNTLKLPKDVEKEIQIPILGAIPDTAPEIKNYMKGNRG